MRTRLTSLGVVLIAAILATGGMAFAQAPDRSKPPVPGPPPTLKIPAIERRTLTNGLRVWLVQMHEVPVVDVSVVVRSGAAADPVGKFGLAQFTAAMLDEGAGTRGALELADAIDFLGASINTGSSFDASTIHLHTLTTKFAQALPLLADVVLRPAFASSDLERLRQERLTTLLQARDNASSLASTAFARLLFGEGHRYGTAMMGTEATNRAMYAADLRAFYTANYQPQNTVLIVVGDITSAAVLPQLEKAFGGWKNTGPIARPVVAAATSPSARQIYLVDKPGAPQSEIRIGGVGVNRTTPDFHVITVMNTILGGSFAARLNQNLREEHGYSYGAFSSFDMRAMPGPFTARAGVQTDKTVESLQEFFNELNGMSAPMPAPELTRAKNLEALSFPGDFETTSDMAARLAALAVYGLPDTFFTTYVPKIEAVTAAQVGGAVEKYLQTTRFAVVVVGDLSKIEAPIRAANLGPVRVVSADDILK